MEGILSLQWVFELPTKKQLSLLKKANTNGRDTFLLLVKVYVTRPEMAPEEVLDFISAESKKQIALI